ncbi:MAG: hypothetical protein IJR70_02000 [Eubacterium sp.]|nr:hypothetical protein [Eubacterium sp.]
MTRNTAIATVLEYFRDVDDINAPMREALSELQKAFDNYNKVWDAETIKEAVDKFVKEKGRRPLSRELDNNKELPSHNAILREFKMTAAEWLAENYPNNLNPNWREYYKQFSNEDLRNIFISEHNRINPRSAIEYNAKRDNNTPAWQYIAAKMGTSRWIELKEICGVEYIRPIKTYKVTSIVQNIN